MPMALFILVYISYGEVGQKIWGSELFLYLYLITLMSKFEATLVRFFWQTEIGVPLKNLIKSLLRICKNDVWHILTLQLTTVILLNLVVRTFDCLNGMAINDFMHDPLLHSVAFNQHRNTRDNSK